MSVPHSRIRPPVSLSWPSWGNSFLAQHLLLPISGLVILTILLMGAGGDQWLADQLYRWQGGQWLLRDNLWTQQLLHQGGKNVSVLCAVLLLLTWLWACFQPQWQPWRRPLLYVFLVLGLSTGLVSLLKFLTDMDCPWHLQRYGGEHAWIGFFTVRPEEYGSVACFPSGHASAGYGWIGLYFFARHSAPKWRWWALGAVLGIGIVFGVAQQLRGAHFLSHDLWTLGISWSVAVVLYRSMFSQAAAAPVSIHALVVARGQRFWAWLRDWRPLLSTERLIIITSLFFALICNGLFWQQSLSTQPGSVRFVLSLLLLLSGVHALLLGFFVWRWNAKWLLSILFVATAFACFYMNRFNVYLDTDMLRNVLATDIHEASELFTLSLLPSLLGYAVLPIALLWRVRLQPYPPLRMLRRRIIFLVVTLVITLAGALLSFQNISALLRNHREVRYLATPANYMVALYKNLAGSPTLRNQPKVPIGTDARALPRAPDSRPRLLVIVVGETARAQNWGLNGYARQTTPQLAALDVINFPDAQACGSNTEVSVPCMFSPQGRRHYNEKQIRHQQSLLHVLEYAGIGTLWRDNQSGCKGVCEGLPLHRLHEAKVTELCDNGRCLDEILLHELPQHVRSQPGDRVVVLHQLGNHGPAYFLRHTAEFRQFTPTCDTPDLGHCSREQIINSYDNALLYTDHFLAQTIATLNTLDDYDSAMIYMSDHGESLGEKGLYLHGVPYAIAPREQLHIPMVMWFSDEFAANRGVNKACLRERANTQHYSHDYLFSSVLGLMQVETEVYTPEYDLFNGCVKS